MILLLAFPGRLRLCLRKHRPDLRAVHGRAGSRRLVCPGKAGSPVVAGNGMITILVLAGTPFFFIMNISIIYSVVIAGFAGGMQFSIANRQRDAAAGPRACLYALDLAGSVAGALLTALLLVPLLGIGRSLLVLIMLKASSLVLLFSLKQEACV